MPSLSVLITGAASGIGAATAQLAAERGHQVVLADVDLAGAEALAGRLGPPAFAVALDVREGNSGTRRCRQLSRPSAGSTSWSTMRASSTPATPVT